MSAIEPGTQPPPASLSETIADRVDRTPAEIASEHLTAPPVEYVTVEQALQRAPQDLTEQDVDGVFGGKLRIRSLTAAQSAMVKQASIDLSGVSPDIVWAEMELRQFRFGVINPVTKAPLFTEEQVKQLHLTAGPSFTKTIAAIDKISGTNKEAPARAREDFQPES